MILSPEWIDALKARVRLSDIIGQSIKLAPNGHEFKGLCPYHKDQNPSLTVSDSKGFFHCFACSQHGDVFDWLTTRRRLSFAQAAEMLAERYNLPLPDQSPETLARVKQRDDIYAALGAAAEWFSVQLRSQA